jgi:hypothetical protein
MARSRGIASCSPLLGKAFQAHVDGDDLLAGRAVEEWARCVFSSMGLAAGVAARAVAVKATQRRASRIARVPTASRQAKRSLRTQK